jgi:hypothetical protein
MKILAEEKRRTRSVGVEGLLQNAKATLGSQDTKQHTVDFAQELCHRRGRADQGKEWRGSKRCEARSTRALCRPTTEDVARGGPAEIIQQLLTKADLDGSENCVELE